MKSFSFAPLFVGAALAQIQGDYGPNCGIINVPVSSLMTEVVQAIGQAVVDINTTSANLNDTINAVKPDPTNAQLYVNLQRNALSLITQINTSNNTIAAFPVLAETDENAGAAFELARFIASLACNVNRTVDNFIGIKQSIVNICLGPVALDVITKIQAASIDFSNTSISKIPEAVKPDASSAVNPILIALSSGVAAYAAETTAPASCSATTGPTSGPTSAPTSAPTSGGTPPTTTGGTGGGVYPTSGGNGGVYPTGQPTGGNTYPTTTDECEDDQPTAYPSTTEDCDDEEPTTYPTPDDDCPDDEPSSVYNPPTGGNTYPTPTGGNTYPTGTPDDDGECVPDEPSGGNTYPTGGNPPSGGATYPTGGNGGGSYTTPPAGGNGGGSYTTPPAGGNGGGSYTTPPAGGNVPTTTKGVIYTGAAVANAANGFGAAAFVAAVVAVL